MLEREPVLIEGHLVGGLPLRGELGEVIDHRLAEVGGTVRIAGT